MMNFESQSQRRRARAPAPHILLVLAALALIVPVQAQQVSLQALVTPSTTIVKDGRPVTFALHGFIEFKTLADMFPYIESQKQRWKASLDDAARQRLAGELLRRGIESRVVSMIDERPLEALVTHTSGELRQALAQVKGPGAARLWRGVSGGAGEVETFAELLECRALNSGARALQLVSH